MQEIKVLDVKFRNFLSYGNSWTEISFDEGGLSTFIFGENVDTGSANGVGKTALMQLVVYGLYNKSISGISLQRLINSTNAIKNTTMEVILRFSKGGNIYQIHRKRGSETAIILTKDDLDITPDSVFETDTLIESIIGISYDLFSKVIVFSGNDTPFLMLPIAHQRQHIEELFNITILTEKAIKLKKIMQSTESDIKIEEALVKEKNNNIEAHKRRLQFAEQKVLEWEESKERGLLRMKSEIELVKDIDFEQEQQLFDEKVELTATINKLELEIEDITVKKNNNDEKIIKNKEELEHLKENRCPYCKQKYEVEQNKILELETNSEELSLSIETSIRSIEDLKRSLEMFNELLAQLNEKIKYDNLPELINSKNNIENSIKKIEELEVAENPHFDAFEQLEKEELIKIDYSRLDELKSLKDHQNFLIKLLTDKNSFIRRKIINRTIPFLNSRINYYTLSLGLPHVINFDDNMECSVSEYGRELDFGNLSSGEKKRVNLALSLSFRDVLFHLHARVNILLIDEIDASLDSVGVNNVIALINLKTKEDNLSTWVIMHRENVINQFDRLLIVKKSGGFSEMIWPEENI